MHGRYPVLLAESAYRFDNDAVPAMAIYPFMELGPVRYYTQHGYIYVHMDARGTGRSGGTYLYQSKREQRDLYEAIEWIAKQPWSTGKIGGVGQSYYARAQWFMGIENPPHLACIAPYDGNTDTYHASAYTGGIPGDYPASWFEGVRNQNLYPRTGPPREISYDYTLAAQRHPLYDAFWKERTAADRLPKVKVPTFSIGVWGKVDLHLNGNITGFQRVSGPKKLLVFGGSNVEQAVADYSSTEFHENLSAAILRLVSERRANIVPERTSGALRPHQRRQQDSHRRHMAAGRPQLPNVVFEQRPERQRDVAKRRASRSCRA